jgi:hypothetical protein
MPDPRPPIDWTAIAHALGTIRPDGESGGSNTAKLALEMILGRDALRCAVDFYVACKAGRELVRAVLWMLHPWSAMERCYEIYKTCDDRENRIAAVELLSVVGDARALLWIAEFLKDPEPEIQNMGGLALEQFLFGGNVPPERCGELLAMVRNHGNENVRQHAAKIDLWLREQSREA